MTEVKGSVSLKRLETAKTRKEKELALVDKKLEGVRAKQENLKVALELQNNKISKLETEIQKVDNNPVVIRLLERERYMPITLVKDENIKSKWQADFDALKADIDNGKNRVKRDDYSIADSKFKTPILAAVLGGVVVLSMLTGGLCLTVLPGSSIVTFAIVSLVAATSWFAGAKIADKFVSFISVEEAKVIVENRLQEAEKKVSKTKIKIEGFPEMINSVKKTLGRPDDDEVVKAKEEKTAIEIDISQAKDEENRLLEEKLRLNGGIDAIATLHDEAMPKEAPKEKQKRWGPLIVRHPGNNI